MADRQFSFQDPSVFGWLVDWLVCYSLQSVVQAELVTPNKKQQRQLAWQIQLN